MTINYSRIKNRYLDVMCTVNDRQMLEDLQLLIAYVDSLHGVLLKQAQVRAAEEAQSFFENDGSGMVFPN